MRLLTADIGGTNTRLELFELQGQSLCAIARAQFENAGFADFAALLQHFYEREDLGAGIDAAGFAIAGPVSNPEQVRLTNIDWSLDGPALAQRFGIGRVAFLNDFAAVAYGAPYLAREGLEVLQAGEPYTGDMAVRSFIGAGTGLGQALSLSQGALLEVLATEAGHANFAPADNLQRRLLDYYSAEESPVSLEFLLSGRGLVNIHRALCAFDGVEDPLNLRPGEADAPARLGSAALQGEPRALQSVRVFWQIYAAHAGDVALQVLPRAGLYLGGGIAPKLLPLLQRDEFLRYFHHKAKMVELLHTIPVYLIRDAGVARLGAARFLLQT